MIHSHARTCSAASALEVLDIELPASLSAQWLLLGPLLLQQLQMADWLST